LSALLSQVVDFIGFFTFRHSHLIAGGVRHELSSSGVKVTKLFDTKSVNNIEEAIEFISSILKSSTENSIPGKELEGKILLWNEGARRIYWLDLNEPPPISAIAKIKSWFD
jgi:hypothetical protein